MQSAIRRPDACLQELAEVDVPELDAAGAPFQATQARLSEQEEAIQELLAEADAQRIDPPRKPIDPGIVQERDPAAREMSLTMSHSLRASPRGSTIFGFHSI